MATLWFCLVGLMLAMYVVLDGFDLGAAVAGRWVAATPEERGLVLRSIGPVWDGNEVWLIAGGGTLFCAFPALYAASFSGFYLPLMMVLWLLIGRGVSIELRDHVASPVWRSFWDAIFRLASLLLCLFYGVALGNVMRGVPLAVPPPTPLAAAGLPGGGAASSAAGAAEFFLPLWEDFRLGPPSGILDWYTLIVGLAAVAALALHGALWLALKLPGELEERARRLARRLVWIVAFATALVTAATLAVQPLVASHLAARPWGAVFPLLAVAGLAGVAWRLRGRAGPLAAFLASCLYLFSMMASAAFGLYPYVLPGRPDPALGLTAQAAAAPAGGLRIGLAWWIPGMLLAGAYSVYLYRTFAGKVAPGEAGELYGEPPAERRRDPRQKK